MRCYFGVATMLGGRGFGPADWPGHDAQGEGIEGGERGDVKVRGGVMGGSGGLGGQKKSSDWGIGFQPGRGLWYGLASGH